MMNAVGERTANGLTAARRAQCAAVALVGMGTAIAGGLYAYSAYYSAGSPSDMALTVAMAVGLWAAFWAFSVGPLAKRIAIDQVGGLMIVAGFAVGLGGQLLGMARLNEAYVQSDAFIRAGSIEAFAKDRVSATATPEDLAKYIASLEATPDEQLCRIGVFADFPAACR